MDKGTWQKFTDRIGSVLDEFGISYQEIHGGQNPSPIIYNENNQQIMTEQWYCFASNGLDKMNMDLIVTFKNLPQ